MTFDASQIKALRRRRAAALCLLVLTAPVALLALILALAPSLTPPMLWRASNTLQVGSDHAFFRTFPGSWTIGDWRLGVIILRSPPAPSDLPGIVVPTPLRGPPGPPSFPFYFGSPTFVFPLGATLYVIAVSWWWAFAIASVALSAEVWAWRRYSRRDRILRRAVCRRCRYSLVGLPSGAPCPECGTMRRPSPSAAFSRTRRWIRALRTSILAAISAVCFACGSLALAAGRPPVQPVVGGCMQWRNMIFQSGDVFGQGWCAVKPIASIRGVAVETVRASSSLTMRRAGNAASRSRLALCGVAGEGLLAWGVQTGSRTATVGTIHAFWFMGGGALCGVVVFGPSVAARFRRRDEEMGCATCASIPAGHSVDAPCPECGAIRAIPAQ